MKKNMISLMLICPLLFANQASANYLPMNTTFDSYAAGKQVRACKKMTDSTCDSLSIIAKNYNETAATITLYTDFFKIGREFAMSTETIQDYVFYYRMDVYLNSSVHYKGAFLDFLDYHNPTYLQAISLDVDFGGVSSSDFSAISYNPQRSTVINNSGQENQNYYLIAVNPNYSTNYTLNDLKSNNDGSYKFDLHNYQTDGGAGINFKENLAVDTISESARDLNGGTRFEKVYHFPYTSSDGNFMAGPNPQQNLSGLKSYSGETSYYFSIYGSCRFSHVSKEFSSLDYVLWYKVIYGQDTWRAYFFGSESTGTKTIAIKK